MQDRKRQDMQDSKLTEQILGCCFDVMNELGSGFLEAVYKNALFFALKEKGFVVTTEKRFEVYFRGQKIGTYIADLVIEGRVILELKCCDGLIGEHQAQTINYLKASGIKIGLLVNFGKRKLEYNRLFHPAYPAACDPAYPVHS